LAQPEVEEEVVVVVAVVADLLQVQLSLANLAHKTVMKRHSMD
jgi:hypothetical protein